PASSSLFPYTTLFRSVIVLNVLKKSGRDDRISRRYLVLDENTGQATGYYQPPDLGWSDVCLTPDQEMVFLAAENKKQKLKTARIDRKSTRLNSSHDQI